MMIDRRMLSALVFASGCVIALPCAATEPDFDAAGALARVPFDGPFDVERSDRVPGSDGPTFVRWYDASFESCVEAFIDMYHAGDALADGWTLSGYGRDAALGFWRFGLLYETEALFRMEVYDDGGRCRLEVGAAAHGLVGGYYRVSWPPLEAVGVGAIRIDPLVPGAIDPMVPGAVDTAE